MTKTKTKVGGQNPKYSYRYQMSEDIHRNKEHQKKFLDWINSRPEFKNRRPTVEETVNEMTKGCLKDLVEQDAKKAAEKYWRQEAQYYLRHIQVVRIELRTKKITPPITAFLPLGVRGKNGSIPDSSYVPSKRVANDPLLTECTLEKARREFDCWVERYKDYNEFFEVFGPVVDAYEEIRREINNRIRALKRGA